MAWESASGARSSYELPRYDLIELGTLRRLAARLAYGAAKHGRRNYERGVGDAAYRRDRINHMIEHAVKLASAAPGEEADKHLGAVLANAQIVGYLDDHAPSLAGMTASGVTATADDVMAS